MRPYPIVSLHAGKRIFNYRLSHTRRAIENALGILVSRWRILRQEIKASVETIDAMVWTRVLLHSYLRMCDEEECTSFICCAPGDVDRVDVKGQMVQSEGYGSAGVVRLKKWGINYTKYTKRIKDAFVLFQQCTWPRDMARRHGASVTTSQLLDA